MLLGKGGSCSEPGCKYTTVFYDALLNHEKDHIREKNKILRFVCKLCNYSVDKLKAYKYHLWLHKVCVQFILTFTNIPEITGVFIKL